MACPSPGRSGHERKKERIEKKTKWTDRQTETERAEKQKKKREQRAAEEQTCALVARRKVRAGSALYILVGIRAATIWENE